MAALRDRDAADALAAVEVLNKRRLCLVPGESLPSREQNLELTLRYAAALNLDLRRLPPVVHVAGTKGKGSVCAMTEAMLRSAGLRTLFFTSPHLFELRERFRLNREVIAEDVFLEHFWAVYDRVALCSAPPSADQAGADARRAGKFSRCSDDHLGASDDPLPLPSFFMLFTLIAFRMALSASLSVDALVLEVGIGGVVDCTNAVPASVIAATGVSTLDFDHTDVLGSTLAEIATHKAGIFKAGVPALTVPQRADAMAALVNVASEAGVSARLRVATAEGLARRTADGAFPPLALDGDFQRTNAALASALAETFMERREAILAEQRGLPVHDVAAVADLVDHDDGRHGTAAKSSWPSQSDYAAVSESSCRARIAGRIHVAKTIAANDGIAPPLLHEAPVHYHEVSAQKGMKLPPFVAAGLACVRWPGRAQIVPLLTHLPPATSPGSQMSTITVSSAAVPIVATHLSGFMYADCAHTERSMRRAVDWFKARVAAARAASGPSTEHRLVLVFNCPFEKDVLRVLLPLTTVSFDRCFISGVGTSKPTRGSPRTADDIISNFLSRLGYHGGACAATCSGGAGAPVSGISKSALASRPDENLTVNLKGSCVPETACAGANMPASPMLPTACSAPAPASVSGGAAPPAEAAIAAATSPQAAAATPPAAATSPSAARVSWLHALQELWVTAHAHPALTAQRHVLAEPVQEYTSSYFSEHHDDSKLDSCCRDSSDTIREPRADADASDAISSLRAELVTARSCRPSDAADTGSSLRRIVTLPAAAPATEVVDGFCSALMRLSDDVESSLRHHRDAAPICAPAALAGLHSGGDAASSDWADAASDMAREAGAASARSPSQATPLVTVAPPAVGKVQHHILVTGNMYLVGEALHALGAL